MGDCATWGWVRLVPVSLALARERAAEARRLLADGKDPLVVRQAEEARCDAGATFGAFAKGYVEEIAPGFRNAKHLAQWGTTLRVDAGALTQLPLDAVDTEAVLGVLRPIWIRKPETASRLRGRIERVLDAAKARGLRTGENPARWRGHLDKLLPARQRLVRGHHKAMGYSDVPAFLARLRDAGGIAALALEFCILGAARSGEVLGARWDEMDRETGLWTIPAARMKSGRVHRVPLTDRMLAIIGEVEMIRNGAYVFPGQKSGRPLSVMAMTMVLRRLKVTTTVHGFRSAFRDWAGDRTGFSREVAEAALAHVVGDATEQAYRRGDALEQRGLLMTAWAAFCEGPASNNTLPLDRHISPSRPIRAADHPGAWTDLLEKIRGLTPEEAEILRRELQRVVAGRASNSRHQGHARNRNVTLL
jgi:integrase